MKIIPKIDVMAHSGRFLCCAEVCLRSIMCLLFILFMTEHAPVAAQSSTSDQINAAHTGRATFSGGIKLPLQIKWQRAFTLFDLGPDYTKLIFYPMVADGRVFISAKNMTRASGLIVALDMSNGSILWRMSTEVTARLAYGQRYLITSIGSFIYALDPSSGRVVWETPTKQYDSGQPVAVNGSVYVASGAIGGDVQALNEKNGKQLWSFFDGFGLTSASRATYYERKLITMNRCRLFAFNSNKGRVRWTFANSCWGGGAITSPAHRGRIYASRMEFNHPMTLLEIDVNTGKQIGKISNVFGVPAFSEDVMVVRTGSESSTLAAFSVESGKRLWSKSAQGGRFVPSPIIVNDFVIIGRQKDVFGLPGAELWVLDYRTGSILQRVKLDSDLEIDRTPDENHAWGLAAGDGLIIVYGGNQVYAIGGS